MSDKTRKLVWLTLFAICMAQVEASLVVHLRSIYYSGNPLEIFPLKLLTHRDLAIELVRELATVVMILSVALLTARGFTRVFAVFVYVFGLWDLFYYLWLKIMIGWPLSWFEWDVLFLIPWPWLGPWLSPVLIALLFVVWGGWILTLPNQARFSRGTAVLFVVGALLALVSFLLPAAPLLLEGEQAFRGYQPGDFLWSIFIPGYMLMVTSLWRIATGHCTRKIVR
ncbi:hypothetical protein MNBD_GAMMA24-1245 [hydrothermal vent metagenome]|uniref:Uncharacterized protein n=1 Tax=hydrothermal vent metagenome TaxID=652676 RepID=A0A3B1B205_9ZZZZ